MLKKERKKSECRISRDWHQNVFDKFNESPFCSWFLPIATSIVIRSLWGLKISMHFASRKRLHNAKIRPDINSLMQFSLVTLFMFCSEEVGRSLHAASWIRALKTWKPCVLSQSYGIRGKVISLVEAVIFFRLFSWFDGFIILTWSITHSAVGSWFSQYPCCIFFFT